MSVEMKTLTMGGTTFEIVDGKARNDISNLSEAVLYTPQVLTEEQQAQARENIGAADVEAVNELKDDMSDKLPKSPLVWEPWTAEEQAAALEKLGGASAGWKTSQIIEITEDVKLLNINFDGGSVLNEIAIIVDGIVTGVASKYKITVNHSNGYEFIHWNDSAITINTKYTTYVYLRRFGNYWKSESINPRTPGVYGSAPTTKIIPYNTRQPVNATNIGRIGLAEYDLGIGSKVYVMTR